MSGECRVHGRRRSAGTGRRRQPGRTRVGSSATAATLSPRAAASAAVERPMATKRQAPSGARSAWMRRAALGEAATTACSRPAPISRFRLGRGEHGAAARPARPDRSPASVASGGAGGMRAGPARIGRIVDGVVGGDGLDGRTAGLQAPAQPRVGDVRLGQQHAALVAGQTSSRPVPDCWPVGARSTLMPRDSRTRRVAGPIVATRMLAGQPAAQGGAAFRGFRLQRLDGGHAADHEPVVGPGAEGIEGDVEGVLVVGPSKSISGSSNGLGAEPAQGRDEFPGAVRAAGDQHRAPSGHPHAGRARPCGCGRCAGPMKCVDPRFRKLPGPRCPRRRGPAGLRPARSRAGLPRPR